VAEANLHQMGTCVIDYTPEAAAAGGEVVQIRDGRAAVVPVDLAAGQKGAAQADGVYRVPKTAGIAVLDGGRVYWDHSANAAHFKKVNDRDFYLGRAVGDAAAADTTMLVAFDVDPPYDIDLLRDGYLTVPVGTQALGGFLPPQRQGGALFFQLSATNEAQKLDALSRDRFATGANAIAEFIILLPNGGSGAASDYSVGLANGTHATDADAITESLFFHLDGGSTNINAESDDGTTEVAATDTTKDFVAGTAVANRVELWIDVRDPADARFYVDGVEVLAATANLGNVAAAAGPWGLLVHLEKTAGTETADLVVEAARVRLGQK
jgi:predicted RecA/RadA family phage recombinase